LHAKGVLSQLFTSRRYDSRYTLYCFMNN
jgi:hypothetical protein